MLSTIKTMDTISCQASILYSTPVPSRNNELHQTVVCLCVHACMCVCMQVWMKGLWARHGWAENLNFTGCFESEFLISLYLSFPIYALGTRFFWGLKNTINSRWRADHLAHWEVLSLCLPPSFTLYYST